MILCTTRSTNRLLNMVDFVKIDFLATKGEGRKALLDQYASSGIRFLAEKVENPEEHKEALDLGYSYFQGYFFCKPTIISGKDIPAYKLHYLKILQAIHRPEIDFRKLGEIIKHGNLPVFQTSSLYQLGLFRSEEQDHFHHAGPDAPGGERGEKVGFPHRPGQHG